MNCASKSIFVLVVFALVAMEGQAFGNCEFADRDHAIARRIGDDASSVAGITFSCQAFNDIGGGGQCSLVCVTLQQITDGQRRKILVALVGTAGLYIREANQIRNFKYIQYSDGRYVSERKIFQITASRASELQSQIYSGRLEASDFLRRVDTEFALTTMPNR
jgi:hypothetical protein